MHTPSPLPDPTGACSHREHNKLRHLVGGQRCLHAGAAAVVRSLAGGGVAVVVGFEGQGACMTEA